VLQTLINSFRFSGLEYDITLCRAAFLPELSVERRVDVPKKFIISTEGDLNNNNEQNSTDHKGIQEKPFHTSTEEGKSLPAAKKRSPINDDSNFSYLMPPTSPFADSVNFDNQDDDDVQNAPRPITNDYDDESPLQLASYASLGPPETEDENDEINNEEVNDLKYRLEQFHPSLLDPISTRFLVREEEDGGILIEPDQVSASTRVNQDQNSDNNDQEIGEYILPPFVLQPSADTHYHHHHCHFKCHFIHKIYSSQTLCGRLTTTSSSHT
jgi:hypothetical protein